MELCPAGALSGVSLQGFALYRFALYRFWKCFSLRFSPSAVMGDNRD